MALTVESVVLEIGRALAPLEQSLRGGEVSLFFAQLGLPTPDTVLGVAGVKESIMGAADALGQLPDTLSALSAAITSGDTIEIGRAGDRVVSAIQAAIAAIDALAAGVHAAAETAGSAKIELEGFAAELVERLFGFALAFYFERNKPVVFHLFTLLGIIEVTAHAATAATPAYVRRVLRFDRFSGLIDDPIKVLAQVYGWGTAEFDWDGLLLRLSTFLGRVSNFAFVQPGPPPFLRVAVVDIGPTEDPVPGVQAVLRVTGAEGLDVTLPIGARVAMTATADAQLEFGAALQLLPPANLRVVPPTAEVRGKMRFGFQATAAAAGPPIIVFGTAGGSRIEARTLRLTAGADLAWNATDRRAEGAFVLEAALEGGKVVLSLAEADGFLAEILPSGGIELDVNLLLDWSSVSGLHFSGETGLHTTLALHERLSLVQLDTLDLSLTAASDMLTGTVTVAGAAMLGPVTVAVNAVGTAVALKLGRGNVGIGDLSLDFKPPSGLGISVDAALVLGGGFIGRHNNEYSGALDLTVGDYAVKAYGVVQTKLPGDVPGYSFIVALSAEFTPSIQLAFGFSLDGIGGLVGINRTVSVDAVETALWGHHLEGLLFPKDPIATAPQLVAALDSYFPAAPGRYLLGPLAKIGWGDGIVEGELALLLELPEPLRIFLLGEVQVGVPQEEPQLVLHISFAGGLDFGKKLAFFDASLHDSRIEKYPISGDLAFRYAWSDDGVFALAVGGFHPHFQPPAAFPTLKRLSISIASSVAQLNTLAYFALTANTLQFGARVELTAGTGSFNVHGWMGFDALCERHPLAFTFDLSAGVELRHNTSVLASVHLDGHLSGPNPWHIAGEASLSLLFFDVTVHFDKTWGDTGGALPLPDPLPLVIAALSDRSSFAAVLPTGVRSVVSTVTTPPDAGQTVLLDPASNLRIVQRVIPLGQPVTRFGGAPLGRTLQLSMEGLAVFNSSIDQPPTTTEEFAPAQFFEFSDAEKLSLPSFGRFSAGVEIGGDAVDVGRGTRSRAVITPLVYDTTIVDSPTVKRPGALYGLDAAMLLTMSSGMTRGRGLDRYAPPVGAQSRMDLEPDRWVVAGVDDLKLRDDVTGDGSKLGAHLALQRFLVENPDQQEHLQVVLSEEAA